jgi:hypothetical protein
MRWIGVVGDADEPRSCDVGRGLGATTETKMFSQELEQTKKKKAVINSVG